MGKILFIDVDGTLVDYEGHIPGSAATAIREARQNGHRVYICTGRSRAEIYEEIWEIGLDGMIGGNGSFVEDRGEVILHKRMSKEDCRNVVEWIEARNMAFYLECNSGLYGSETFERDALQAIRAYAAGKGNENASAITVRDAFPEMLFGENEVRDDVNKISYVLREYSDYLEAKKAFANLKCGTWGGVKETALFGDIGVPDISKASAVACLLEHLHGSYEDTIGSLSATRRSIFRCLLAARIPSAWETEARKQKRLPILLPMTWEMTVCTKPFSS